MIEVTFLSVLQGIAEFLPISSSGHLVLAKHLPFMNMGDMGMRIDIFLHVGTLLAIFAFYWRIIRRIIVNLEWSYAFKVAASAVPAGLVGVLFKDQLEMLFASTTAVGAALVFTGIVLTLTRFLPKGEKEVSFLRAILMGLAQAVAILPGVSRSGMTLAAARASKVDGEKAAEFSFLMSAPPIAGAALLDLLKPVDPAAREVSWLLTIYGCVLAALVGYFSLKLLVRSLKGRWFWLFGPYCLIAGLLAMCCGCSTCPADRLSSPFAREAIEWQDLWMEHADEAAPKLPRVLLLGDSISRQYRPTVSRLLEKKAYVANSASSRCVGDPALLAETRYVLSLADWDVIHLNNGLHGAACSDGDFGRHLREWIDLVRSLQPKARLVWATITTPRNDFATRVAARNAIADRVVASYGDIAVDDLGRLSREHPEMICADKVHFTGEGAEKLAASVADSILPLLTTK